MLIEGRRKCGLRAMHPAQVLVVYVIDDAIGAVLQTAKFNRSRPMAGEEGIVKLLVFTDNMSLGKIEPYVVKISQILTPR
jgi:hypothetical protein